MADNDFNDVNGNIGDSGDYKSICDYIYKKNVDVVGNRVLETIKKYIDDTNGKELVLTKEEKDEIETFIFTNKKYINYCDELDYTALYFAVKSNNNFMVDLLIRNGAELNYLYANTPRSYPTENVLSLAMHNKNYECFKMFVEHPDIKLDRLPRWVFGETILMKILIKGYSKSIKYHDYIVLLLKHGANIINLKSDVWGTAMDICIKNCALKYIYLLLEYGFNMENVEQMTFDKGLVNTIESYNMEAIHLYVKYGASIRCHAITNESYYQLFTYISERIYRININTRCIHDDNQSFIEFLFDYGIIHKPFGHILFEIDSYEELKNTKFYRTLVENGFCEDLFVIETKSHYSMFEFFVPEREVKYVLFTLKQ